MAIYAVVDICLGAIYERSERPDRKIMEHAGTFPEAVRICNIEVRIQSFADGGIRSNDQDAPARKYKRNDCRQPSFAATYGQLDDGGAIVQFEVPGECFY